MQNKVFGPGWTASFDGDDSGAGGAELYDSTLTDGVLAVLDANGETLLFRIPAGTRRTGAPFPTGHYKPVDADTKTSGATLKVSGAGASTIAELITDGVVTKFKVTATPSSTVPSVFRTVEVREPATSTTTTYAYDSAGRVSAIVAPLPDGIGTCVPGTPSNGCRALKITYATATTAVSGTPGDFKDQVKKITAQVNTDADKTLAEYKYDTSGRLVEAKDSRTGLATTYTWTGTGTTLRLATLTPPGQAAFTFSYDTGANKIAKVTRPNPSSAGGGTAQLAAFVYGVPTSGTGLPDLGVVSRWAQDRAPTWGAAVFGPDQAITGITPAAVTNPEWWKRADLSYTDAEGYTLNTAEWGAGNWQYTANDYDNVGNIVRAWDQRAIRHVLDAPIESVAAAQFATVTKYNDDITDSGTVVTPAGTLVTDVWAPATWVVPASPATPDEQILLRTHAKTTYDQGAPNSGIDPNTEQPYRLPTKQVVTSETPDIDTAVVDDTLSISFSGYDKVESSDPKSGWDLGTATSNTVDMDQSGTINSGDITTVTRYDGRGRAIENRQPKSNGSDAGTRRTVYYTGDTSAPVSGCRNTPQYAGWVCQVGPIAQPSGQSMPVTTTTAYTWDGQTATEQDVSGSVTSTTTTTFNAQDRPITTTTSVSGLSSSTSVPAITTSYDTATGQATGTTSTAGSTAMTYDNWGRQLTYTNTPAGQPADTATTTYNNLGQVIKIVDGNGETRYTYDGTDANGQTETRGLVTGLTVKVTGGTEYTTTGAYDHASGLVTEKLPGNITRRSSYDLAGQNTVTEYHGAIIDPDTGTPSEDPQPLAAFATYRVGDGKISHEIAPGSNHSYRYDQAERLTKAENDSATLPTSGNHLGCQTNTYTFDNNGNRTSQKAAEPGTAGACSLTGATTTTRAYDAADRPTTGGNGAGSYTYDPLGRQTKIPTADAPQAGLGAIDLAYYDTDNIKTITQNGTTTSFTLDGASRRLLQTITDGTSTTTLQRHYTDDGDNPTWTQEASGGNTVTTRYTEGLDGDLGLTLTTQAGTTTAQLALTTNRGDNATTLTVPATGVAIPDAEGWRLYNEYGDLRAPTAPSSTTGSIHGIGYGWLGAKQRATLNTGLTLMGMRLYSSRTGSFTTTDPIYAANATDYSYPRDPINSSDISGKRPDIGDKPPGFTDAEWENYRNKMTGRPYNKKTFNQTKKKLTEKAKVEGNRNRNKRKNDKRERKYRVSIKAPGVKKKLKVTIVVVGALAIGSVFMLPGGIAVSVLAPKGA